MTTGQLIKAARKKAGMTQAQLAEKAGVAAITIQQYELGKRQPRLAQLQAIAAALGVPVQELISDWEAVDKEEFKRVFIYGEGIKDRIDAARRSRCFSTRRSLSSIMVRISAVAGPFSSSWRRRRSASASRRR